MITLDMLIPIAAKGALVLLLAAIFALLMLNRSAAFRHMVWAGGLMALLVLPALSFIVPELPVPGVVTVAFPVRPHAGKCYGRLCPPGRQP